MEKIKKLKKLLNLYHLDGYIVPKNDEFFSEYVPENKDRLKFISNFSGSYGFAVILRKNNYLFVDGRYTQQALDQSGKVFKIVTIPTKFPNEFLENKKIVIGYDPKLFTQKTLNIFFKRSNFILKSLSQNLIDKLWLRQDKTKLNKFYSLPKNAVDENYKSKIKRLMPLLKKKKIDIQFISSSENISWLLNIRGKDVDYSPIANSYLLLDVKKNIYFFCDLKKIDRNFKKKFNHINILDINLVEKFLFNIKNKNILLDAQSCSLFFTNLLKKNNKIKSFSDPIYLLKSVKSKLEIKNTIKSHIYDGSALTKFLFWVKRNYKKKKLTELSVQKKLLSFRKKNKNFMFSSFPTISGSGPNGAIIHYRASKKSNRVLKAGDIYLVDSGGQYNYGTTDVTRTISLNNYNKLIKEIFTRVLKGHIAVANYKIKSNTNGAQIDMVARKPLQEIDLNYAHGTGHGVGYFLNVHEGPQAISKNNKVNLREGMILSNEPGYYKNGKFGIRIENLVRVKKNGKGFKFVNLTMAPIDKSLIDLRLLKEKEISWLNNYHKNVFINLKKYMNKDELFDLKQACSEI